MATERVPVVEGPQTTPTAVSQATIHALVGAPPIPGNRVKVLRNGDEIFPSMLQAIEDAEERIELLTFVYWKGEIARRFAEALSRRAQEGLTVRVVLDAFGGRLMPKELIDQLDDAGVDFHWFRPPTRLRFWETEHRTHRKILICDETVGFTGGVGIAEEWTGNAQDPAHWRDTHLRFEGPAVRCLRAGFLTNYLEASGQPVHVDGVDVPVSEEVGDITLQVLRGAPGVFHSDVGLVIRALVGAATERVWLETAYLAPDGETVQLLGDAVDRGCDVRLVVPGPHIDKRASRVVARAAFDELLDRGVRIYEFQPTMLHCKVAIIDQHLSLVGSANVNGRSMQRDDEEVVAIHDDETNALLAAHMQDDIDRSEEIREHRWRNRSLLHRARQRALDPFRDFF